MAKLTNKQRLFVDEFVIDLNASEAARRAGFGDASYGRRLCTKAHVSKAIETAMQERADSLHLTSEWILQKLIAEATYYGEGSSHSARVKALELLGKHLGLFEDRVHLTKRTDLPVEELSDDELHAIIKKGE